VKSDTKRKEKEITGKLFCEGGIQHYEFSEFYYREKKAGQATGEKERNTAH